VQETNIKYLFDEKLTLIETFKTKKNIDYMSIREGIISIFLIGKPCFEKNAKEVLEVDVFMKIQKSYYRDTFLKYLAELFQSVLQMVYVNVMCHTDMVFISSY